MRWVNLTKRSPPLVGVPLWSKTIAFERQHATIERQGMHLLRLWGHQVEVRNDGIAGLEYGRRHPLEVALIDIGLPGLDGYRLAEQVRMLSGGERVLLIAVTGYGTAEDRGRALAAGFDAHLVKPVDLKALARLLDTDRS